jgi:hypothetical protein
VHFGTDSSGQVQLLVSCRLLLLTSRIFFTQSRLLRLASLLRVSHLHSSVYKPIVIDHHRWGNGSVTSLGGGAVMCVLFYFSVGFLFLKLPCLQLSVLSRTLVMPQTVDHIIDYLFSEQPGTTTAFPDDVGSSFLLVHYLLNLRLVSHDQW